MEIKSLQSNAAWCEKGKETKEKEKTFGAKEKFSTMLRQMETGGPVTDTGEKPGENTATVTRVMSDGSVLITVYEEDKVVAQTKTRSPHPEENPTIISTRVEKAFPDTEAEKDLAGVTLPSQMFHPLMQKEEQIMQGINMDKV